jgi:hypothetical protein
LAHLAAAAADTSGEHSGKEACTCVETRFLIEPFAKCKKLVVLTRLSGKK